MSNVSSEPSGRGISVTIKSGKGYDETWHGFRGLAHEVREDVIGYFGIDPKTVEGLDLHSVASNATQIAHGVGAAAGAAGGVVVTSGKPKTSKSKAATTEAGDEAQADPWAAAESGEPAAEANPNQAIYDAIKAATTVDEIKLVFAKNKDAMTADDDLRKAWGARGKELAAASK